MTRSTRDSLLDAGMGLLLRHGYNGLGVQTLLAETGVPKGSFYHHFDSKQDFVLAAVDRYMTEVHAGLDASLGDRTLEPLDRVRAFFELTAEKYRGEGYLGCMLGGLGQELSGVSKVFRDRIDRCFDEIAERIAACLREAQVCGDMPADADPGAAASLIVSCWEGAALRSRIGRGPEPLISMLDFCFAAVRTA